VRKAALLEPNLRAASLVLTPYAHPDLVGTDLSGGAGEGAGLCGIWRCC
jgi:hypothetical protein